MNDFSMCCVLSRYLFDGIIVVDVDSDPKGIKSLVVLYAPGNVTGNFTVGIFSFCRFLGSHVFKRSPLFTDVTVVNGLCVY